MAWADSRPSLRSRRGPALTDTTRPVLPGSETGRFLAQRGLQDRAQVVTLGPWGPVPRWRAEDSDFEIPITAAPMRRAKRVVVAQATARRWCRAPAA